MTKNLVTLNSDVPVASSDSCDDSDTENYNYELQSLFHVTVVLRYWHLQ